jgi:hypothetical protein
MPNTNIVQRSQRSQQSKTRMTKEERVRGDLLWHSHDESIDATTLKDLAMRISKGPNTCFIVIATQHEMNLHHSHSIDQIRSISLPSSLCVSHFGLCSGIFAMTSEDDDLIEVSICLVIVGQHRHAHLKSTTFIREMQEDSVNLTLSRSFLSRKRARMSKRR